MIKSIEIKNFKSIDNLKIDLGRLNIIIGANGSGKTNILEAIAMGAASSADKLDYEFISNRLRVSSPEFMYNAFPTNKSKFIEIKIKTHNNKYNYNLISKNERSWIDRNKDEFQHEIHKLLIDLFKGNENPVVKENAELETLSSIFSSLLKDENIEKDDTFNEIIPVITKKIINDNFSSKEISDFLIYTPEYSFLRKFEEPGQIIPLGLKGEGLFYTIKQIFNNKKNNLQKEEIKRGLHLLDWFDDFYIPDNLMSNEYKIAIKDRFIRPKIRYFDQRSANEGFLYLLFYLVLFTSKNTPKFFAIDNIETGFNPKLCRNLTTLFYKLAKKFNKQVIVTTHNPAILDGLNLSDDKQRLFVAYRKNDGSTALERIKHKPNSNMKLSELWMKGIIGGLPDNF